MSSCDVTGKMLEIPEGWYRIFERLARGGICLILGGTDTGKSTFIRAAASYILGAGIPAAIVCADLGQSDVGPPACVGGCVLGKDYSPNADLEAHFLYYVGSLSPYGNLLQGLTGLGLVTRAVLEGGASAVLVNTTGWIGDPAAWHYKMAKVDLLRPSSLMIFQEDCEMEPFVAPLRRLACPALHFPEVSAAIRRRSREERQALRRAKLRRYFEGATPRIFSLRRTGLTGRDPWSFFQTHPKGLLAGLFDEKNRCLGMGVIQGVDPGDRTLEILSPVGEEVRRIHVGPGRMEEEGALEESTGSQ